MRRYLAEKKTPSKIVIAIIALASTLSISITCFILREVIARYDVELVKVIAFDVYEDLHNELFKPIIVSQTMANDHFLHQNLKLETSIPPEREIEIMKDYLNGIRNRFSYDSAFIVSDATRNFYVGGEIKILDATKNAHDVWYDNFIARNVEYAFNVDTNEANKLSLTVFVNTRIKDTDGNILGVCGVGVGMSALQKILNRDEKAYKIKVNLVNEDGLILVDTDSENIENSTLKHALSHHNSEQFYLEKVDDSYIVTKYIPAFDWYLVIQRDVDDMQSAFSNVILYMFIGFLIALILLLAFVQISLNRGQKEIEESAKKHGIASHAGLYVSMHLIDLKKDCIHELSRDPNVYLFDLKDGDQAEVQMFKAIKEMTAPESLDAMTEFIDFKSLPSRMINKHAIHTEFLSARYGWCKAYFMIVDDNIDGAINQIVFAIELIDEEKRREKHLLYLSETDAMTGLRNRGGGEKAIKDLMAEGREGMFCLLDADKFKSVNDTYGHDVGDKVIKAIGDCLKKTFKDDDIIMRLGGDEFAVYAIGVTDYERGKIITDKFFAMMDRINIPELADRKITISLGAALFMVAEGCEFDEIYKRADISAYKSKKVVGNCATFYTLE